MSENKAPPRSAGASQPEAPPRSAGAIQQGAGSPAAVYTALRRVLRLGARQEDLAALAQHLHVAPEEAPFARALARELARVRLELVRAPQVDSEELDSRADPSRVLGERASLINRLAQAEAHGGVAIEELHDLRALLAVVRAGSLTQRREALLRIGELLTVEAAAQPAEHVRVAVQTLAELRAFPIGYELWQVRAHLPGTEGKEARAEGERWDALAAKLEHDIRTFWDGEDEVEPVHALADDVRAQLLLRTRDLSEEALRHLSAVIAGCDGTSTQQARIELVRDLRYAGDPRLLPALRALLDGEESDLVAPAARALSSIADPRVHPILHAAYARTSTAELRLVLAAALAVQGDRRALPYVREALSGADERLLPRTLEALAELGGRDEVQSLTPLLGQQEPRVLSATVRALGRIADGRALIPLSELRRKAQSSALLAEIEEAESAIAARMELLGEEAPAIALRAHSVDTAKHAAAVRGKDPAMVRVRAFWSYFLGGLWLRLGMTTRGIGRLEIASSLRPDWVAPVLRLALTHARRAELPQALAGFRRALGIDRLAVERSASAARWMAQTFLRRAEAMRSAGRDEIARGLIEEALAFDLRRAPAAVRFALEQRQQALEALRGRPTGAPP